MSRHRNPRWPVWLVLIVAAGLTSLPLPEWMTPFRPPWAALVIVYWVMMWPRTFGIGSAWILGLVLDILQGELLGQNALALSVISYLTLRFHLQIRIFPLWQLTMSVFALLMINAFILFWIDGVAGNPSAGLARWTQPVVGGVLWPIVMVLMDQFRRRIENRSSSFS
ncbi:MAG: rod shape-determining protein MreD [Gammaproteobacteria bacterium]|nr:rod shape-determining protein MreD [Gammaproteobacteria bacterium]